MYIPKPIDTSDVILPEDIDQLIEDLARNTHEVWAQQRIKEGWSYGETRSDQKKTHPCLIEYEKLPENEKEYDRNTSRETLKLIVKMGYKIIK